MTVLTWLLQLLVFFVALKVAQILFWNVRRHFYVHPWVVELVVGALVLLVLGTVSNAWWLVITLGLLTGLLRGDQESDEEVRRQLL